MGSVRQAQRTDLRTKQAITLAAFLWASLARAATVGDLRCEYLVDPQGIDVAKPRLSWVIDSGRRGASQTAYQVMVASSPEMLERGNGDLWNSGKVDAPDSINVTYQGQPLGSLRSCYWKVCVWDDKGDATRWSSSAQWSMGLLQAMDWKAKWIGLEVEREPGATADGSRRLAARWLRKEFTAERKISRATVCYSGLGWSELYLNGEKIGDEALSPALSDYRKRVFYVTHDVTASLRQGGNAIGVVLGNGRFYAPRLTKPKTETFGAPRLLLQLHLEYDDGGSEDVFSDETWKLSADGPIVANNEYDGEEYDARKEFEGWAKPGFHDAAWQQAQLVEAPAGVMSAPMIDPIRVTGTMKPVSRCV